jgi:hypothetical protein
VILALDQYETRGRRAPKSSRSSCISRLFALKNGGGLMKQQSNENGSLIAEFIQLFT